MIGILFVPGGIMEGFSRIISLSRRGESACGRNSRESTTAGLAPAAKLESTMENIVLDVADVQKSFAGLHALSNINLIFAKVRHTTIGRNGVGRSTVPKVCIGRLRPNVGTVNFLGENLTS